MGGGSIPEIIKSSPSTMIHVVGGRRVAEQIR
jgi:hypothetical protein